MQTRLTRHIKARHKDAPDVAQAGVLCKIDQHKIFKILKRKGIYEANMKIMKSTKEPKYIRERNRGKENDIIVCMRCKGFFRKLYFHEHKLNCVDDQGTYPISLGTELLKQHDVNPKFTDEILSRIRDDSIGLK